MLIAYQSRKLPLLRLWGNPISNMCGGRGVSCRSCFRVAVGGLSTIDTGRMISRREFIAGSVALAVASSVSGKLLPETASLFVNDIHSQLNSTRVQKILKPRSVEDVQNIVRTARKDRKVLSVAGGRHAMGGQQFGTDALLIDIRKLCRVIRLDREHGILEAEAGIEWPELIDGYLALQNENNQTWGIAQKQTGADRLTMAGTISANAHGRGLTMKTSVFLTAFNMAISNSLSSATLKTSCTKVFSPAIAQFRWRRPSHPHRSNCPMRIGGNYCISPTQIRKGHSKDTQITISRPMGKYTGPIHTS